MTADRLNKADGAPLRVTGGGQSSQSTRRERTYCTKRDEWRDGCKKGRRGKPMRAMLDVYVTIDGLAAVNGDTE